MIRFKQWFRKYILKRKYFIGIDPTTGEDYGCKVIGYHKNGRMVIVKILRFKGK